MSLRLKINLAVSALTLLFVGVLLGLQLRGMRSSVNEEVVAANRVAAQLLRGAWSTASLGTAAMRESLRNLGRVRSNDITLYDARGETLYTSPPSPYKAGRDAPAWFAGLVAPLPTVHAIEFPDGRLEVRSNASRAVLDAWDDLLPVLGSALVLLLAVNIAVLWLVGRSVRPFARIVDALEALQAGRFDASLPPLPGREAGAIARAFNRMTEELPRHLENERRALRAETELSDRRELARWVEQRVEQERRAIARELHDELGQSVTAMRSMALAIVQREEGRDETTAQAARLIADESARLYDAMHGLIPRLAPPLLDELGLEAALEDLVARMRRSHPQVAIELTVDLDGAPLSDAAALALYRAAQEGLTNALRHAAPHSVRLRLFVSDGQAQLEVADDGRGLGDTADAAPRQGQEGHYGLRWLAERVQGLGGHAVLEPAASGGSLLSVRVPLGTVTA